VLVVARARAMERKRVRPRVWKLLPVGPLRAGDYLSGYEGATVLYEH
jgi:hypothetical protein